VDRLLEQARQGLVFVDEVDKIRSHVAGQANVTGIRAQEALLTLIENEAVPFHLPEWAGGGRVTVDSSGLLFVCAGAFEGLYDAVYNRITVGRDRGALKPVTVVDGGRVREELQFDLRDWLKNEDLFDYGITPQFLSRFDGMVVLDNLKETELLRILMTSPDSVLRQSTAFFASQGIRLEVKDAAARRIAAEAARQPRLGARALKEVFRRVIRNHEFEPRANAKNGVLVLDLADVEKSLVAWSSGGQSATSSAGWDESPVLPWESTGKG
jgi:ATP-dependent Clp protease ATP-binding subunit ClpX